ncbi:ribosomal protein L18e/L15P, partial [Blyttiomyces helicus]
GRGDKTAGRGQKGWKARAPRDRPQRGWEGGQSPIKKRFPKFGKREPVLDISRVHLDSIQHWIDTGRLDASKKITLVELVRSNIIKKPKQGVMVLERGGEYLTHAIDLEVTYASEAAIGFIEANGGKITTVYHDKESIEMLLYPHKYMEKPGFRVPESPTEIARYADPERRGFLAPLLEGTDKQDVIRKVMEITRVKQALEAEAHRNEVQKRVSS